MRPGRNDRRHKLRITGDELQELQRHIGLMAEAFRLDRKIDQYAGTRPITLYRWDLECLKDVIAIALEDKSEYAEKSAPEYQALARLGERLRREYDAAYPKEP